MRGRNGDDGDDGDPPGRDRNSVNAAAALGAACADYQTVGGVPFVVVPEGYKVENLEHLLGVPSRKKGTIAYRDAASFSRAVNEQKTAATQLYGNKSAPSFTAVFNDHDKAVDDLIEAGWRDHLATYACPLSVEWKIWTDADGKRMNQEAFATFIEDNAPDCLSPDSATMIEISRKLEAKKKVNFASGIRLDSGETQLTYEEEITGTVGKGQMAIPETFSVGISVLEGGPKWAVHARLRYRIDNGKLAMWFDLDRPHKVLEEALDDVWKLIETETGLVIFNGG